MNRRPVARRQAALLAVALLALSVVSLGALARAEVVQLGQLRVSFDGALKPNRLPRSGTAPVHVAVAAKIAPVGGAAQPQLRKITVAINRHGRFETKGLPRCRLDEIQPATTAHALAACRSSLVGEGTFTAKVLLAQQAPYPAFGDLHAFNGVLHGKPVIFAHVYGTEPVPTSYTITFALTPSKGTFGTVLTASLPQAIGDAGYVTGLTLNLGRSFSSHGHRRSYISAGCPAPPGFGLATFPFARATFGFDGGRTLTSTLTRTCRVRR
jgi:hypothetical protein